MIKQHCDICDRVISGTEGYRTIHFGRGYNTDVKTGYDPMVVCKDCWYHMLESIGATELYRDIDANRNGRPKISYADTSTGKKPSIVAEEIAADIMKDLTNQTCQNCSHKDSPANGIYCGKCSGFDNWEAVDNGEK